MLKKSQVSFEFILIFTLVLMALIGFIYIINRRIGEISEQQEFLAMKNLANNIKNEVVLASSVRDNYIRKFEIPYRILGKEYNMFIENDELVIETLENEKVSNSYFTVFPIHVRGTFIEDIQPDNRDHCITKNEFDGIRIAKNQASLASEKFKYEEGDEFDVLVRLNCLENIQSFRFTLSYDDSVLELIDDKPVTRVSDPDLNPLFSSYTTVYDYSPDPNITQTILFVYPGRFTYGYIGSDCETGSGNVAKLRFRIKDISENVKTEINFDQTFEEDNLLLLDCSNKITREGLPDSKKGISLTLLSS